MLFCVRAYVVHRLSGILHSLAIRRSGLPNANESLLKQSSTQQIHRNMWVRAAKCAENIALLRWGFSKFVARPPMPVFLEIMMCLLSVLAAHASRILFPWKTRLSDPSFSGCWRKIVWIQMDVGFTRSKPAKIPLRIRPENNIL